VSDQPKPVTPPEARQEKTHRAFHGFVIIALDAFGRAEVSQKKALAKAVSKCKKESCANQILENGWLNIEAAYEAAGWKVTTTITATPYLRDDK